RLTPGARELSMLNWRRAESPLELSIEILFAAIADEQRHRLDLHAVANQRGGTVETHRRQPLMHRHADHAPEHAAQIRALAMQRRRMHAPHGFDEMQIVDKLRQSRALTFEHAARTLPA